MHQQVYHSREIQAWEARWFAQQNSVFGLMQQVAWSIAQRLNILFQQASPSITTVALWCGAGNNAGDGYCVAHYLHQYGYQVEIFATEAGHSQQLKAAIELVQKDKIKIHPHFNIEKRFDCHIDALFGIGLNRDLDDPLQAIIQHYNVQSGLKVAIDIPSGLNANTGQPLPVAVKTDQTSYSTH